MDDEHKHYGKPPIIECVVELQFGEPITFDQITKRVEKFKRFYPQETRNVGFNAQISEKGISGSQEPIGLRLASHSALEMVVINTQVLVVSQLAPYPGWTEFRKRIGRDIELYFDTFSRRPVVRVGARYINRIDVPFPDKSNNHPVMDVATFLNVYPTIPSLSKRPIDSYAVAANVALDDGRFSVTLQSASVVAPAPKMYSFTLDIDIGCVVDIPARRDALLQLIDEMRSIKNRVFEASITDESRRLFQ
ncbi:TIGR04255 family protein [Rhizobium sp. SG570]|uniref:TIGR04255 family protein n=1 Tax=Rhizobium sp. SG570 TaxID=2587113 RepID=UPI001445369C|nr:TIGR04255 family protein [Rhizobium sp. SG570]NKJ34087.1 uncharacterized protein (TIGR04255 family) [Rhizobium sp. SG570]